MLTFRMTTAPQKTMCGKRTGSVLARIESDWSANVYSVAGPNATAAKNALINALGRMAANDQRAYVFCGDSTVLVVSFAGDSWQYDIIGPNRQRSGVIMPGCSSFSDAKQRAIEHAAQSYSGVVSIS